MSAVTDFLDKIIQRFPPSFRWDEAQKQSWSEDMVRELGGFPDAVLNRAIQQIIRTRTETKTPLVSECINACLDALKWLDLEAKKNTLPIAGNPGRLSSYVAEHSAERLQLADDLLTGPQAKEAAREGWIGAMRDFARKNGRLPMGGEIARCKKDAKDFDLAYAEVVRGRPDLPKWIMRSVLENLGAAMLANREELAKKVLGR